MISQADEKFIQKWEKTLQKGRFRYFLILGGGWGFFMFVFITLFDLADKSFIEAYFSWKGLMKLGIWLVIGICTYAPILWLYNNRQFKQLKEKHNK